MSIIGDSITRLSKLRRDIPVEAQPCPECGGRLSVRLLDRGTHQLRHAFCLHCFFEELRESQAAT
ncbi:hypothetical protein [Desulfohalovibrio reitneri]|uniref:hypothetical protein n=1 Tax=Desulfohalovibrio reitneri TaxID=1307759 RepID=UPI0004A6BBB8|nr:hypothetical protein [Desulfohalovibrio reitneri]